VVLIFGFGPGKAEDLGEVAPITCPNCHNEVFLHHVRSKKSIRLYFVPVVPYGTDEYLLCPICTNGLQISETQRAQVEAMRASTVSFRRGHVSEAIYRIEVQQFWTRIGIPASGGPGGPSAGVAAPPPPGASGALPTPGVNVVSPTQAPSPPASTLAGQLAQLDRLHREGVLTEEEFAAAKRRVLGS